MSFTSSMENRCETSHNFNVLKHEVQASRSDGGGVNCYDIESLGRNPRSMVNMNSVDANKPSIVIPSSSYRKNSYMNLGNEAFLMSRNGFTISPEESQYIMTETINYTDSASQSGECQMSITNIGRDNAFNGNTLTVSTENAELSPTYTTGVKTYTRNDVLCGRGGGTNVHPGNRRFRDLINASRREYLMARKNDRPTISLSIVRSVRKMGGRFLKKNETLGLWFDIGDAGAREKTAQALRQKAPEMRKMIFQDEIKQRHREQQQAASMSNNLLNQLRSPFQNNYRLIDQVKPSDFNLDNSPCNDFSLLKRYLLFQKKTALAGLAKPESRERNSITQNKCLENMITEAMLGQGMKRITPRSA